MTRWILALMMALLTMAQPAAAAQKVKVTVLSTMLADIPGRGEWGYAALVEVDGRSILFDTGAEADTVLKNAAALGVDLSTVEEVVISHNHWDHVGGLITLRKAMMLRNSNALSVVHVGAGVFLDRPAAAGEMQPLAHHRAAFEATGGRFVEHGAAAELAPGVWITGPVPRVHPERNYPPRGILLRAGKPEPDTIPEDSSLVIWTPDGLVVITGCGHAGAVNIVTAARRIAGERPLAALIGGLHLINANQTMVDWTAAQLKAVDVAYFLSGHCTGLEPTRALAQALGLGPDRAAYAPVGASFTLGKGIDARTIARPIPPG